MRKIGIFGGSFDPVHAGHLMVACALYEKHHLDTVYFVPTQLNPLKERTLADAMHRVNMLEYALAGTPFRVVTDELDRPPPSYMIDTVEHLLEKEQAHYFLLLGADAAHRITEWKSYQRLLQLAQPLIASRSMHSLPQNQEVGQLFSEGWTKTPLFDISSTECRQRLAKGLFCGHLLDRQVYQYIITNRLYGYSSNE